VARLIVAGSSPAGSSCWRRRVAARGHVPCCRRQGGRERRPRAWALARALDYTRLGPNASTVQGEVADPSRAYRARSDSRCPIVMLGYLCRRYTLPRPMRCGEGGCRTSTRAARRVRPVLALARGRGLVSAARALQRAAARLLATRSRCRRRPAPRFLAKVTRAAPDNGGARERHLLSIFALFQLRWLVWPTFLYRCAVPRVRGLRLAGASPISRRFRIRWARRCDRAGGAAMRSGPWSCGSRSRTRSSGCPPCSARSGVLARARRLRVRKGFLGPPTPWSARDAVEASVPCAATPLRLERPSQRPAALPTAPEQTPPAASPSCPEREPVEVDSTVARRRPARPSHASCVVPAGKFRDGSSQRPANRSQHAPRPAARRSKTPEPREILERVPARLAGGPP